MKRSFKDSSVDNNNRKWYDEFPKGEAPCKHSKSDAAVIELKAEAKRYLEAETSAFQLRQSKTRNSETAWLKTMTTQGTSSDKVAASIVLIQDNPKYNITRLASVISQVRAAKHNQCTTVITALKDLFLSSLLHPNFKLLQFEEQDLDSIGDANSLNIQSNNGISRNKLLACWYFEDQLREQYERFILSLAAIASDTVETNREKSISVMTDLLIGNAEQEHKLLELIVNKVGDPNSKVASKAVFCLNKLLHEHSNMKIVVLREVEKLLFRKNVAQRAQYYAICLLTQFVLDRDDGEIAATLIDVYFAFFKACLKKGEPDSRMMAAILTGVNRAYRFAKMDSSKLQDHIDSVYKVVHVGSFNVSLNALNLLYQVTGKDEKQLNRFHSAFYRKLLDPQIGTANKRAMFLNLLFRVLKNDNSVLRSYALIKRILQVTLYFPSNMTCSILYIVSKVLKSRADLKHILPNCKVRVKVEDASQNDDSLIKTEEESSDEEEAKVEVEENSIILSNVTSEPMINVTRTNDGEKEEIPVIKIEDDEKGYDPFCRNPLYANANKSLSSELIALSTHFHPSVSLFANLIIQGKSIDYTGDPLEDLTLIRFLDRYVFKNPKKLEDKNVVKKNDPLAQRAGYTPKGIRNVPVGSAAYLNENEARIPVDELFLYRYLKRRSQSKVSIKSMDDDNESVNSEEFNEMLDELGNGEDEDLEELDIAAELQSSKKGKKGRVNEDEDDEDDEILEGSEDDFENDDESIDDGEEDEMNDDEDDEDLQDLSDIDLEGIDDEDLSEMEFNDDDFDDDVEEDDKTKGEKKRGKKETQGKPSKKPKIDENIFMSAEKFAEMLEEHGRTKGKDGGSNAFSTMDGASLKQLDWEAKREQRLRGTFDRRKRKGPKKFQKKYIKKAKR